jgi:hypothetical protein
MNRGSIRNRATVLFVSVLQYFGQSTLLLNGHKMIFSWEQSGRGVKLTNHLHRVDVKNWWSYTCTPPHIFNACTKGILPLTLFIYIVFHSFILSFFLSFFLSLLLSFILSFFLSFYHFFFHSFILSFILSLCHSFFHSLSFFRSFFISFFPSVIHSFIHSFSLSLSQLRNTGLQKNKPGSVNDKSETGGKG